MKESFLMSFTAPTRRVPAYSITAGLAQVIEYIEGLHFDAEDIDYLRSTGFFHEDFLEYLKDFRFTGDIYAIPEGTVVFLKEPLDKGHSADHGSPDRRNGHLKYYQPSKSDLYKGGPELSTQPAAVLWNSDSVGLRARMPELMAPAQR